MTDYLGQIKAEKNRINAIYEIVLMYGDNVNNGCRAMVSACPGHKMPYKGATREYNFQLTVDDSWPLSQTINYDALITQWRNGHGSPKCAMHILGDKWKIKIDGKEVYEKPVTPSVVTNFCFQVMFHPERGHFKGAIDDSTFEYSGPTMNDNDQPIHWSTGVYRPQWDNNPLAQGDPPFRRLTLRYE